MTSQRALLALAITAAAVAGIIYWVGARRVAVVTAAGDLTPGRAIRPADLEMRELPPDLLPPGTIVDPAAAIGRYPRAPTWKGQLLVADAVAATPAAFDGGIELPAGHHAVAVPVTAAHALGGAVVPGSRVDVIAVPVQGKAPAGRSTEMLASAALVLDVRGEQGGPLERRARATRPGTAVADRIGSVIIAVTPAAQMRVADRVVTSTFVLALATERP